MEYFEEYKELTISNLTIIINNEMIRNNSFDCGKLRAILRYSIDTPEETITRINYVIGKINKSDTITKLLTYQEYVRDKKLNDFLI